jgi:hypothetical protein
MCGNFGVDADRGSPSPEPYASTHHELPLRGGLLLSAPGSMSKDFGPARTLNADNWRLTADS